MSTRLHLALLIVAHVVALATAVIFVMPWIYDGLRETAAWTRALAFFGIAIPALVLPEVVFRTLVRARCPKCGKGTSMKGSQPVTYRCSHCSHVEVTSMYLGRRNRI